MNWKKLTLLTGVAVAVVAIPGAIAQDEPVAPAASSTTQVAAPSSPSVGGGRPSGHWSGARGDWRNRGDRHIGSGERHRHRWGSGHHHRWHRRYYHRPRFYYSSYPFGYPFGYGFGYPYGYGYGYPYYGASASLYYNGYRPTYRGVSRGGSVVVQVQQELARAGYYRGAIDGVIGNGTRSAIRAYERANGLPVDGRLDTQLLRTMGLA